MLRPNCGVIQPSGNRMRQLDLTVVIREEEGFGSLQHTEFPRLKTRCMSARANSFTTCFNSCHPNLSILQKRMEQPDNIAAAAPTRAQQIGKPFFPFENLATGFDSDDALKIEHHHGVGVGTERRA